MNIFSEFDCDPGLVRVQVEVVTEACEDHLIVARYVEAELALTQIGSRLGQAVERSPGVALLYAMNNLGWRHVDLQSAKALLVVLVGKLELVAFCSVLINGAVEIVVVHLEEDVVLGVGIVHHPLQSVTLSQHGGKNECSRGG